jgi:hypothetical protein
MAHPRILCSGLVAALLWTPSVARADDPDKVDFTRHIRPILSDKCFACHGPEEKKAKGGLRLDVRDKAIEVGAIVPGKPQDSELLKRIHADEKQRMPPLKSNKTLTAAEKDLLKRWIEQGAEYREHWAFVTPVKKAAPKVKGKPWPRSGLDYFILSRLEKEGLQPSAEADRMTLIRRLTLDLTGLPPTLAEIDTFLADRSPEAYEKVVNRLLSSPRYGEHMARYWLDAARYGDTHGMHLDNYREIWPYREWVIGAFNKNLPFNQFIVEQLAGDLLPKPTMAQQIATGFLRCHVTTNEGGSIDEEVYVRNVVDRVDTNGTVLLGLTVGCARCHDHKYDPFSMKDYYQTFAFFNNIDGPAMDGNIPQTPPVMKVMTPAVAERYRELEAKIAPVQKRITAELAKIKYDDAQDAKEPMTLPRADFIWLDDGLPAGAKAEAGGGVNLPWKFVDGTVHSGSKSAHLTTAALGQNVLVNANPGLRVGTGDKLFAYVYLDQANPPKQIMLQWHTDTWRSRAYWGENLIPWGNDNSPERYKVGALPEAGKWVRLEVEAAKVGIQPGTAITGLALTQHGGSAHWDAAGINTQTPQGYPAFNTLSAWARAMRATKGGSLPKPIQDIVKLDPKKWNADQKKRLREHYLEHIDPKTRSIFTPLHQEIATFVKQRDAIDKSVPTTLIFKEKQGEPRPAYILKRGEYDQKKDKVGRATPAFLPSMPNNLPKNRLGFAQWLTAPNHPLTARVAVNRLWQQVFGTGLVKTAEDFGAQGELPSHPELLDWLAVEFMEDGWDVKKFMKRLVLSATYRQSAKVTKDRLAKDPHNRLLSRGPRYRLDAEMLRDQALYLSGLLVEKVGGPSVKPPQPRGLWEAVAFTGSNTGKFSADTGHDKVHRRSMYTFWKRTAHPPQMGALDAPSREACTVRRERTNTPLQALLLMNEPQFVESARMLGQRTMKEGGTSLESRLKYLFRVATARVPDAGELMELTFLYNENLEKYTKDTKAAAALIAIGETKADTSLNASELAAWAMMANLVLNLDEVLNRE